MSELKATKGQWKKVSRNVNEMMMTFHGVLIGDVFVDIPTKNEEADSYLISESRNLYNILSEMVEMQDCDDEPGAGSEWHTEATAVLARARGEC